MCALKLREYQKLVLRKAKKSWDKRAEDKRLFLVMPTGTGKTITSLSFVVHEAKPKNAVWVAHQTSLVEQSRLVAIERLGGQDIGNDQVKFGDSVIQFLTWQTFREMENKSEYDLVIGDEIHCGGTRSEKDKYSFTKIFKKGVIKNHIYLSATPWRLDADLFPDSTAKTCTAALTWKEVFSMPDCPLNDVHIIKVDVGLKLELEREGLQETVEAEELSSQVADLQDLDEAVDFNCSESERVMGRVKLRGVFNAWFDMEGIKSIEEIPPTIVFCRGINGNNPLAANNAIVYFRRLCLKKFKEFGNHVAMVISGDNKGCLDEFKRVHPKIAFVANLANEGFDYPELVCAIDLNMNADNETRTIQKMGRIMRTCSNKGASHYYYPDSADEHLKVRGVRVQAAPDMINNLRDREEIFEHIPEEQREAVIASAVQAQAEATILTVNTDMSGTAEDEWPEVVRELSVDEVRLVSIEEEEEVDTSVSAVLQELQRERQVIATRVGFIVKDASGSFVNKEISFKETLLRSEGAHDSDGRKREIREFYEKHGRFPSQYSKDVVEKKLGKSNQNYCCQSNVCYDEVHDAWARSHGYGADTKSQKQEEIREFHRKHGRFPSQYSKDVVEKKLGKSHSNYCSQSHVSYDEVHDAWARSHGFGADTKSQKQEEIREFYKKHGRFPSIRSKDAEEKKLGGSNGSYCSQSSGCYDEAHDAWARSHGYGSRLK